jgi:ABC-type dipeptide/oligopeptide/nickel transport system permease subunit
MKKWAWVLVVYLVIGTVAALGIFQTSVDPSLERADLAPGSEAFLGTDHLGRSVGIMTMEGVEIALMVGSLAAILAVLTGVGVGLLAGWFGGVIDRILLWCSASVAAIPGILLVMLISRLLGGGLAGVFVAVGLVSWVGIARLVRNEVQQLRTTPYFLAARLHGAGFGQLLRRHLLPQIAPLASVQFVLLFIYAVKAEAVLSFLGVGIENRPSWGRMIADAWAFDDLGQGHWWRLTAATVAMAGLLLALQGVSSALERRWSRS